MTKREVLETWVRRVWVEEDASAIYEHYVPDGRAFGIGDAHQVGPKEFEAFHSALLQLISHVEIDFHEIVEQGDWISYVGMLRGIDRKTKKAVSMTGGAMCKIIDDKIVIAHNTWDFLGLFCGLGFLPDDTFTKAISGQIDR